MGSCSSGTLQWWNDIALPVELLVFGSMSAHCCDDMRSPVVAPMIVVSGAHCFCHCCDDIRSLAVAPMIVVRRAHCSLLKGDASFGLLFMAVHFLASSVSESDSHAIVLHSNCGLLFVVVI